MLRTPARQRAWYWVAPLAILLLAAITRLWNLGTPHALVFDETYYVKDAYSLTQYGYEGKWADGANPLFESGDMSSLSAAAEYVVHGEYLIADDGLPPANGQKYVLPGGAFFDIRDGSISRISNYYNLEDWLAQVR